jgi:hypothetical protein
MNLSPFVLCLLGEDGDDGESTFDPEIGLATLPSIGFGRGDVPDIAPLLCRPRRSDGDETVLLGDMAKKPASPFDAI